MTECIAFDLAFTSELHTIVAAGVAAVCAAITRTKKRAKAVAKKIANATGLDEISPYTIQKWLIYATTIAATVGVGFVIRSYLTPPPPTTTEIVLRWIVAHAPSPGTVAAWAAGAVATYFLGLLAGAMVPSAMSWFGKVVSGVGTIHAEGGVAATLQWLSTKLIKPAVTAMGGCLSVALKKALCA